MDQGLVVDEVGSGSALVLLGGCPTPAVYSGRLAAALSDGFRVLTPHLPGYDVSPSLPHPYELARFIELLEDELVARGIESAHVVGSSLGAWRALMFALRAQRVRVRSVVSLGGLAGLSDAERAGFREFAGALRAGIDLRDAFPPRFLSEAHAQNHPADVEAVRAWIDAAPASVIAAELEATADEPDLYDDLADLEVPVLARVGESDAATPPSHSRLIVQAAPNSELQLVAGAGHALLYEDLAGTAAAVRAWISNA